MDVIVSATLPTGSDPLSIQLRAHVERYQIHECKPRCFKNGHQKCKYGFPFAPCPTTNVSEDSKSIIYRRCSGDERVVPYNPVLLLAAASNVNIQMVTSDGAKFYAAKYAAKAEPTRGIELRANPVQRHFELRSMSVNEAALNLLQVNAVLASREVVYLSTDVESKRRRLKKDKAQLRADEEAGVEVHDIFADGFAKSTSSAHKNSKIL